MWLACFSLERKYLIESDINRYVKGAWKIRMYYSDCQQTQQEQVLNFWDFFSQEHSRMDETSYSLRLFLQIRL